MKKIFYAFMALVLLSTQAFAADKAKVKVGPAKFVAKQAIVAAQQGAFINITMGGSKGLSSGSLTILVPSDFSPSKGDKFGVFSLVGEEAASNPDELAVSFSATKIKRKGLSVSSTSYAEAADTVTTGSFTVKSYDPETKVLKFNLKAKASPYTFNKGASNETSSKKFVIKAQGVVTLP